MKWPDAPLGDLTYVAAGGGAPQDPNDFADKGDPFVRAGSLKSLVLGESASPIEYLAPEVAARHKLRLFPADTVVFAKSGMSASIGLVHRLRRPAYVVNHLAALVCKPLLDSAYLHHYLRAFSPSRLIQDAAYPSIRLSDIAASKVPVPPISEQRRIAAILDKADALRAKRREALVQVDRLPQSIFVEMFGDPVVNPKKWELVKLGSVGSLDRGVSKHRPRNDPRLLGGRYPLIQTGDVANSGGYIRKFQSTYSDLGLQQSKLWPRGTLCITIAANIAKTGILTFDACFPDSVVGFTSSEESTVEYVRVWLSFLQKTLEENAPESAQKNINLAILRDLDMPLPPAPLRERFTQSLRSANALSDKMRVAAEQLEVGFSSLQQRAFRGEL